jgi:hypothetical protein
MRCEDVRSELAFPTGALAQGTLARHLAACPRCAAWAEQSARLDRLWEATRPAELSEAAWERIWSRASEAAFHRPEVAAAATAPEGARPWRGLLTVGFAVAQAAVLLLGFVALMERNQARRPVGPASGALAATAPTPATTATSTPTAPAVAVVWTSEVPTQEPKTLDPSAVEIEIETNQLVLIDLVDPRSVRVQDLAPDENPYTVSPFSLPLFNAVESLASLQ